MALSNQSVPTVQSSKMVSIIFRSWFIRSWDFRSWCFRFGPLSTQQWKLSPLFGQESWDESIFYEVATKKLWLLMFCWFFFRMFLAKYLSTFPLLKVCFGASVIILSVFLSKGLPIYFWLNRQCIVLFVKTYQFFIWVITLLKFLICFFSGNNSKTRLVRPIAIVSRNLYHVIKDKTNFMFLAKTESNSNSVFQSF